MLTPPRHGLVVLLVVLAAAWPRTARAQPSVAGEHAPRPVAAWLSWGGGPGSIRGTSVGLADGMHRANLSIGAVMLTYRTSDLGPAFGNGGIGIRDEALLAGIRTGGHRAFTSMAVGYAQAEEYAVGGGPCGPSQACARTGALGLDISMHSNWIYSGLALSYSGTIGPARVAYYAYTVALEVGWFGR